MAEGITGAANFIRGLVIFVTEELHLSCQQQCKKQPQTEGEDIKTSCLNYLLSAHIL
jgi:hypothetical protein